MTAKKARERLFLDEFATIVQNFPEGAIIESEQPDFLIIKPNEIIGVEIVDYVRGQSQGDSSDRRNEILWQRVADTARKKFERQHNEVLMVQFYWCPHQYPRQSEVEEIANEAVELIAKNIPSEIYGIFQVESSDLDDKKITYYVSSIHITRVNNTNEALWTYVSAGFISITPNEVQQIINKKDKKVPEYLNKCQEVWLLVIADGIYISSSVGIPQEVLQQEFISRFFRVFLYNRENKGVSELQVLR